MHCYDDGMKSLTMNLMQVVSISIWAKKLTIHILLKLLRLLYLGSRKLFY
jgi:hypothetical protein